MSGKSKRTHLYCAGFCPHTLQILYNLQAAKEI